MSTSFTPSGATDSWVTYGSQARCLIPNGAASRNSSEPMLPTPIDPSTRPESPVPK